MNRPNTLLPILRPLHSLGRLLTSVVLLVGLCGAYTAQAQARYSYSADGSEVTDSKTGLIWRRCSEGQSWSSGTCSGTAVTYTHEPALVQAKTQTGWRLPNVKELSSITDRTRRIPAIDVTAFPATPANSFWTSTPDAGDASLAWYVDFSDGIVYLCGRSCPLPVRLVR
jgi:hypothetical protein